MEVKEVITPYVRSANQENKDFRNRTVFGLSCIWKHKIRYENLNFTQDDLSEKPF